MRQDTFTLAGGGELVFQSPVNMSADDYEDFTDWLALLQRKVRRSIVPEKVDDRRWEKAMNLALWAGPSR